MGLLNFWSEINCLCKGAWNWFYLSSTKIHMVLFAIKTISNFVCILNFYRHTHVKNETFVYLPTIFQGLTRIRYFSFLLRDIRAFSEKKKKNDMFRLPTELGVRILLAVQHGCLLDVPLFNACLRLTMYRANFTKYCPWLYLFCYWETQFLDTILGNKQL